MWQPARRPFSPGEWRLPCTGSGSRSSCSAGWRAARIQVRPRRRLSSQSTRARRARRTRTRTRASTTGSGATWSTAKWDRERSGAQGPADGSRVLEHDRDFFIIETGIEPWLIAAIQDRIPGLWHQLTGKRYAGRISTGLDPPDVDFLTVVQAGEDTFADTYTCGSFGSLPGPEAARTNIYLFLDQCTDAPLAVFAHEFGHALGFHHVSEDGHVMNARVGEFPFTDKEQHHAQLAYRVGRGAEYCGEPFTGGCP